MAKKDLPTVKPDLEPKVPPPQPLTETGKTGLKGAQPGQGWLYDEVLPELRGAAGMKRYRQMMDNDPICSALIYAVEALVRHVDWRVEAAQFDPLPPKEPDVTTPPGAEPPQPGQPPVQKIFPVPADGPQPKPKAMPFGAPMPPGGTPQAALLPPGVSPLTPPKPKPEDPRKKDAEEAAHFLETVLFEDMDVPFGDVVSEILTMLPYGFALLEVVAKKRDGGKTDPVANSKFDDGYTGIAKLAPRAQETVHRWVFDKTGRWLGVEQYYPEGGGIVPIPAAKLLHFRTTSRLLNPEGRSILRGAYVSWIRKSSIEDAEGRVAARSGGVVELRVPGELLDVTQTDPNVLAAKNAWQTVADRLAADRQGSVLIPSDVDANGKPLYELKFTAPETRRQTDLNSMVERYNKLIAMTVLADFLLLGHETVGSFALADSKTSIFAKSVGAVLDLIAEQFNRVLIPRLWAWNGFDSEYLPKLVAGDLETRDLAALAAYVSALANAGLPLFPDEATENYLREQGGLPPRSEESGAGAQATPFPVAGQAEPGAPPLPKPDEPPPGDQPPGPAPDKAGADAMPHKYRMPV